MQLNHIIQQQYTDAQCEEHTLSVKLEPLAWESEFFARNCARLVFDNKGAPPAQIAFTDFDIVQSKIPANRLELVDQLTPLGFQFVEGEADFILPIDTLADKPLYRVASEQDIPAVRAIVKGLFSFSRFRMPWYTNQERDRFYEVWAENAVHGLFDDVSLVIEDKIGIHGFITLRKLAHDVARIGLLAVRHERAGCGSGKSLIQSAQHWCAGLNIKQLCVATQTSHLRAMNLYIASGAKLAGISYWLYK
ncbi:dTDP-4-amino-4,6-dideoxy-D-galactose acyltransferase [Mycoavidus sp. B2-EB]|uniref:dTDP-4-amino-4,6-dideoxy-D-galactose acyltransferase n=1 Tax=Mycoavidus sp. B2-EB TaxID=2651972 RepID=UPI001626DF27|nr:dTDP-4-amino-4,6-dideoxy-D-galactose acyltransferase [Mycoavidus sp. B2-EB]BBO60040.1 dTDP-fucosamine acetyltransferase [Mycoavidus sp. B2-EB]